MAAPTNVRVESNLSTQATIRWTYGGANAIAVYRAVHGGAFSEITTPSTRVAVGTTIYQDNTAATGVFYDYKLSDDVGSTFSSVVSVVIQVCTSAAGSTTSTPSPSLPQFVAEDDVNAQNLQQFSQQVEASLGGLSTNQDFRICPSNGALVLDCGKGGPNFIVEATTDINSISIVGCQGNGSITFTVPANTTRRISGWHATFGLSGDEGTRAPVVTGSTPQQVKVPMTCKCKDLAQGAIGLTPGFNCYCEDGEEGKSSVPANEAPGCSDINIAINSSRPNNSMDCNGSKAVTFTVTGGCPPYTWTTSGGVQLDTNVGTIVVATPPANTGSGVAGTAYTKGICGVSEAHAFGSTHLGSSSWALYKCDDTFDVCNSTIGGAVGLAYLSDTQPCATHLGHPVTGCTGVTSVSCGCTGGTGTECATAQSCGVIADQRTAGMISSNCNPCGLSVPGQTVTVKDTNGIQATVILRA